MSKEAMKLALGKIKSARDCHPNAVNTLLFEAEEILEEARAKPDFWEGYVPEPVKPAQQEYASFAEWAHDYVQDNLHKLKPAQRTWVGLTDEEVWDVYTKTDSMQYMAFSRAIEAKLREKNNG